MDERVKREPASPGGSRPSRPWRRLHASTYVVLLLTAAVLFLLNVPGQCTPYVGVPLNADSVSNRGQLVNERLEHGWPFAYLVRDPVLVLVARTTEHVSRPAATWSLTEAFLSFDGWRLVGDLLIALCVFSIVAISFEYWRRQRRAVWQLRLSDFFGLTAVAALATWYAIRAHTDYADELQAKRMLGLHVEEDGHLFHDGSVRERGGPTCLRAVLGEERYPRVFDRLVFAKLSKTDFEQLSVFRQLRGVWFLERPGPWLANIAQLEHLEAVGVSASTASWPDAEPENWDRELASFLPPLGKMPNLYFFVAHGRGVGDRAANVIASFPRLRILDLYTSSVTNAGVAAIAQCETLEELYLSDTAINDDALIELTTLPRLKVLGLWHCALTDAALEHLSKLVTLRRLNLNFTNIKGGDLYKLAALPHLEFLWLPENVDRQAVADLQRRMPGLKIKVGLEPFEANK